MKGDDLEDQKKQIGVELKYCERCGGLWVRERGAGVYCGRCQGAIEELPAGKRKPKKIMLPIHPSTAIDGYAFGIDGEETNDFRAAGGLS